MTLPDKIINTHMDMSAVRACRILTYGNRTQLFPANKLLNTYRLTK